MLEVFFSKYVSQADCVNLLAQQACSWSLSPQMPLISIPRVAKPSHALDPWWQERVTKVSEQCGIAKAKGNQILGLVNRNIVYKEKELIIPLYRTIVRTHLEYCLQAWRPYRKKDIDMLERVQRGATKR